MKKVQELMERTLGERLRAQRKRMHLTQEELANQSLIPKSTISAYEGDKVDISASVIVELSKLLQTTPNYLLGFDSDPKANMEIDEHEQLILSLFKRIQDDRIKVFTLAELEIAAKF